MKFVCALIAVASLVACGQAFPGRRGMSDEDMSTIESASTFDFSMPEFFIKTMKKIKENLSDFFWYIPDMPVLDTIKIPKGANTTSTVKIVDGHVITINETTYDVIDEGTSFRIRIVDVRPLNETESGGAKNSSDALSSVESMEDFNNEILKNTDALTA